jgi:hypothetical protein
VTVNARGHTVAHVKRLVSVMDGFPPDPQRLWCRRVFLEDSAWVSDFPEPTWNLLARLGPGTDRIEWYHWLLQATSALATQPPIVYTAEIRGVEAPLVVHAPIRSLAWSWKCSARSTLVPASIHAENFVVVDQVGRPVEATCSSSDSVLSGQESCTTTLEFKRALERGQTYYILINRGIADHDVHVIESMSRAKRATYTHPAAAALLPRDLATIVAAYDSWTRDEDGANLQTPQMGPDRGCILAESETETYPVHGGNLFQLIVR